LEKCEFVMPSFAALAFILRAKSSTEPALSRARQRATSFMLLTSRMRAGRAGGRFRRVDVEHGRLAPRVGCGDFDKAVEVPVLGHDEAGEELLGAGDRRS
jgi:hypothetical protein